MSFFRLNRNNTLQNFRRHIPCTYSRQIRFFFGGTSVASAFALFATVERVVMLCVWCVDACALLRYAWGTQIIQQRSVQYTENL